MRKHLILILVATLSVGLLANSDAREPKNVASIKTELIRYHDSGNYLKDQAAVINQAMVYLKERLANEKKSSSPEKLAIVLDIDETSLSNYASMHEMDFGGKLKDINEAEGKGNDPAIQPTLELYRYAKANNIAVFFVTGRTEQYRDATIKNLQDAGYKDWNDLILKPETYQEKSAAPFKIAARDNIEKQGYHIILNIGDQKSDLVGHHAEKTFKLPNPYYMVG
jgi:acid phosphatase